jgi:peptide/nickel transport system substrate-binding protein
MRQRPIGTGPFKFAEFKPNELIKVAKNPDYWKPGRPYLDGIEYTIIPNRATAMLAFIGGKFDMTFPFEVSIPMLKDVKNQAPNAICELAPGNASTNLIMNRDNPPFNSPDLRKALAYAIDRKSFIDILAEGQGDIGGAMQPLTAPMSKRTARKPARSCRGSATARTSISRSRSRRATSRSSATPRSF